ncbi:MAG: hypothetical protein HDQ88_02245 [Clostridia bacterium]|nr:hypothetical protein [Clostridia bacterium]
MATPSEYKRKSKMPKAVSNDVKRSAINDIDTSINILDSNHVFISEISKETTRKMIDNAAVSAIIEAAHRIGTKRIDKSHLYDTAIDIFAKDARQFEHDVSDMLRGEFDYMFDMIVDKASE